MQIPKQPRSHSAPSGSAQTEQPVDQQKGAPGGGVNLSEHLHQACKAYADNVASANLTAQNDYAKAYLGYLETLQASAKSASSPMLEFWKDSLHAYGDAQAIVDAQRKYALAHVDQLAAAQKALAEAESAYLQSARDIWNKLQGDIERHNKEIAYSLKEALLKTDVGTIDIPALSYLYQGIRTIRGTTDAPKTS